MLSAEARDPVRASAQSWMPGIGRMALCGAAILGVGGLPVRMRRYTSEVRPGTGIDTNVSYSSIAGPLRVASSKYPGEAHLSPSRQLKLRFEFCATGGRDALAGLN